MHPNAFGSTVVAVLRCSTAGHLHAMVAWQMGDWLRALAECRDVQALPPPFSPGGPQFAPMALEWPDVDEPVLARRAISIRLDCTSGRIRYGAPSRVVLRPKCRSGSLTCSSAWPPISHRLPPIGLDLAQRFFQRPLLLGVDVLKLLHAIRVGLWPTRRASNLLAGRWHVRYPGRGVVSTKPGAFRVGFHRLVAGRGD
jgi:hypothetical protein